jgi:hypothetical protein
VNNVNVTNIHNTYNTVVTNTTINRVSFNGRTGGVRAEPTAVERGAMNEHHVEPTELQLQHEHAAAGNRSLLASVNRGRPTIAATPQAGAFDHPGVVAARGNSAHKMTTASGNAGIAHGPDAPKQVKAQPQKSEGQPHAQGHPQGAAAAHPQGQRNGGEPNGEEHRHKEG